MNDQEPDQTEAETNPERLQKTGEALVDEEEVVVAEVNGLAYSDGVLIEIAWRYNKYPGLKSDYDDLRETLTTPRSHERISGTDILRTAAEQVSSEALAEDLRSMASDIDAVLHREPWITLETKDHAPSEGGDDRG